jgi:uncharacterized protein
MNKTLAVTLSLAVMIPAVLLAAVKDKPPRNKSATIKYISSSIESNDVRQFKLFLRQARSGDPHSQRVTASHYDLGLGTKKNLKKAKYWYRKSAEQGNAEAQYELGYILAKGSAGPKDAVESQKWLCAAWAYKFMNRSYPCAAAIKKKMEMQKLTMAAAKLRSQNRNVEATELLRQAAEADYGPAQFFYAQTMKKNDGKSVDWKRACDWIERSEKNHFSKAAFFLGICHVTGEWHKQDYIVARHMFENAARFGDAGALRELGILYIDGNGAEKNPPYGKMLSWIGLVMKNAKAIKINVKADGRRIPTAEDALTWLKQGVELGDAASEWLYGNAFYEGYGVDKNLAKAHEWILKAATQGVKLAMNQIAAFYKYGVGTEQNVDLAYAWSMVSARLGSAKARQSNKAADVSSSISPEAHLLAESLYEKYFRNRV